MIRSCFLIKIFKNFYNYLFSKNILEPLETTSFRVGKQTTFVCSKCGKPFLPKQFEDVQLDYIKGDLHNQHLISGYFKVLKYKKFFRGVSYKPQIQHFNSIRDKNGELVMCLGCKSTNFQNILVVKILDINIAVLL